MVKFTYISVIGYNCDKRFGSIPSWFQKCIPEWWVKGSHFHKTTWWISSRRVRKTCLQVTKIFVWVKVELKSSVLEDKQFSYRK